MVKMKKKKSSKSAKAREKMLPLQVSVTRAGAKTSETKKLARKTVIYAAVKRNSFDRALYKNYLELSDEEMDKRFKHAVKSAIDKQKIMGLPVARYDSKNKKAYLEHPDGRREYVQIT